MSDWNKENDVRDLEAQRDNAALITEARDREAHLRYAEDMDARDRGGVA